jgi:hypothetical protein
MSNDLPFTGNKLQRTTMNEVSLVRLYLLRALYLLVVVGLGVVVMPGIIHHDKPWELNEGVVQCMLAAFWASSVLGLRYPLQMLPVLIWELLWKCAWLIVVAAPLWTHGYMDESTWSVASAVLWVVIIPFVIPWQFVYRNYLQKNGDAWR